MISRPKLSRVQSGVIEKHSTKGTRIHKAKRIGNLINADPGSFNHLSAHANALLINELVGSFIEGYFEQPEKMKFGKTSNVGKLFE